MITLNNEEHRALIGITRGETTHQISLTLKKSVPATEKIRRRIKQRLRSKTQFGLLVSALKYGYFNQSLSTIIQVEYVLEAKELLNVSEILYVHLCFKDHSKIEIADQLHCSLDDVSKIRKAIYLKWNVKNLSDFMLKAIFKGYIQVKPIYTVSLSEISDEDLIALWRVYKPGAEKRFEPSAVLLYEIEDGVPYLIPHKLSSSQLEYLSLRLQGFDASVIAQTQSVMKESLQKYFSKIKQLLEVESPQEVIHASMRIGLVRIIPDFSPCTASDTDKQILQLIASGITLVDISKELQILTPDVSIAVRRLFTAWQVYNYEALILKAYTFGILPAPER